MPKELTSICGKPSIRVPLEGTGQPLANNITPTTSTSASGQSSQNEDDKSETEARQERANRANLYRDQEVDRKFFKFISSTKESPDYICTCCHRTSYRGNVRLFQQPKNNKILDYVVDRKLSVDNKEWLCYSCARSLDKNMMPACSVGNHLQLDEIPECLRNYNEVENCAICHQVMT